MDNPKIKYETPPSPDTGPPASSTWNSAGVVDQNIEYATDGNLTVAVSESSFKIRADDLRSGSKTLACAA